MLTQAVLNTGGRRVKEDRRHTDKPELNPTAVRSLPIGHAALSENRTLFPATVVDVDANFSERLLISGRNNRKLGEAITKGKFKGYALYALSLEERATCPEDCAVRGFCYGNGMHLARRHRIVDQTVFQSFLNTEISEILADPIDGLMVRLHVLGDFPSVEYVKGWAKLLKEHDRLACYGYTHRRPMKRGGDAIGDAIEALKKTYPDRFRIRWSSDKPMPDGAIVIDRVPTGKRAPEGLVCPAQTDATACCATCGLCWEGATKKETIVFIKHGPKFRGAAEFKELQEIKDTAPKHGAEKVRAIAGINVTQKRDIVLSEPPKMRIVAPTDLRVEPAYQRDLSGKSLRLIRQIVTGWDWTKFKAPICAETSSGLFIIDGQHTAIAAASHPEIKKIPVMVVPAARIERRAEAFVSHNRDRLTMTPAQIFYGDVAAGKKDAVAALAAVERAGGDIPRLPVPRNYAKPGQITAVGEIREIQNVCGSAIVDRIVRIAVASKVAPISKLIIRALRTIMTDKRYSELADLPNDRFVAALASLQNIDAMAQHYAAESGQSRYRAATTLLAKACKKTK